MIKYPNGKVPSPRTILTKKRINSAANRGMGLENDINLSNEFYIKTNRAIITKRPTPINIVKVDYEKGAKIVDAYFEKQSTTDYNGVYKGRYLDFEAKSTKNKSSFPLSNITSHQIEHLKNVLKFSGIAFFIIEFAYHDQVFLLDASYVTNFYENEERKSIPFTTVCQNGLTIKRGFNPRLDYLSAIEEKYFTK